MEPTTPQAPGLAASVEPLDAVFDKRDRAFVLLVAERHYDDSLPGFNVDVASYDDLGLDDTSGQWFATYEEADAFARPLAALLRIDIERVL